ncbi:MAG: 30S ribosomal protein S17 [Candidatus Daviesbacteria bacterium]|nr:30S ribosomal protein S17 [Candidatus Daviesbacteria bacterium]
MIGRIVSTKLKNTATVLVERKAVHPLYKKSFIRSKKYLVDDSIGVKIGDIVEILKIRPVSKKKHFKIIKVVGKNLEELTAEKLKEEAKRVVEEVMPEKKKQKESTVNSPQLADKIEEKQKRPRKKRGESDS